jgi:hypothetical protein
MARPLFGRIALAAFLLSPSAVLAFGEGQTGFSGRDNSCLACHGSKQYDGLKFKLSTEDTVRCVVDDDREQDIPVVQAGQAYTVTVEIPAPGANAPTCPTYNCCAGVDDPFPPPADATCLKDGGCNQSNANQCCTPGLQLCEGTVAGFNAEVVGGGAFTAGVNTRLAYLGDETFANEVTHTVPLNATNGAQWTFQFTAPSGNEDQTGLEFWVGANVANGNSIEDSEDLNSNFYLPVAVRGVDGAVAYPGFCLVCPNGNAPFAGCCCDASGGERFSGGGGFASLAVLSLLGFLFTGRRRRR